MLAARQQQFDVLREITDIFLAWGRKQGFSLHTIECPLPFVNGNNNVHVTVFFQTNKDVEDYRATGVTIIEDYLERLMRQDSVFNGDIGFTLDSHENVEKNYRGDYFQRMR